MATSETKVLTKRLYPTYPFAVGTNAEKQVALASLRSTGMIDYLTTWLR